jgi:hypothetical protein
MQFKKLLLCTSSLLFICHLVNADCSTTGSCFNDGVDFGKSNSNIYSGNNISNSALESALGKQRIIDAKDIQSNIQNTMGNNYKNLDGITQAGNQKATSCNGKTSSDCDSYNYYNDPLTRKAQEGIESVVSIASNLINKQINPNVNISEYCNSNPSDTICVSCKKDPNQPMCKTGNKCTQISYKTGEGDYVSQSCQVIGQRDYSCNKWVDDVEWKNAQYQCNPYDPVYARNCNRYIANTYCKKTQEYVPYQCKTWKYQFYSGCRETLNGQCNTGSMYRTPGWCGGKDEDNPCDGVDRGGRGFNWNCINSIPEQKAVYTCVEINKVTWKDNCSR